MKFCHTQKNRFKFGSGSLPFHKIFPQEFQLIKQMIAKYPQRQLCWLLQLTQAQFQSSTSVCAGLSLCPLPLPLQVLTTITMCAKIRVKFRQQGIQNFQENIRRLHLISVFTQALSNGNHFLLMIIYFTLCNKNLSSIQQKLSHGLKYFIAGFLPLRDTVSFLCDIFFETNLSCLYREVEVVTPKRATLACGIIHIKIILAEVNQDLEDSRRTCPSPLST